MGNYAAMTSVFAVPLRIVFAVALLAVPFVADLGMANPWYVAACMPVFVLADIIGKWRLLLTQKPVAVILKFLSTARIYQTVVVGVIYLPGARAGLSRFCNLHGRAVSSGPFRKITICF